MREAVRARVMVLLGASGRVESSSCSAGMSSRVASSLVECRLCDDTGFTASSAIYVHALQSEVARIVQCRVSELFVTIQIMPCTSRACKCGALWARALVTVRVRVPGSVSAGS